MASPRGKTKRGASSSIGQHTPESRPKRQRRQQYPYGEDFISAVNSKSLDDSPDELNYDQPSTVKKTSRNVIENRDSKKHSISIVKHKSGKKDDCAESSDTEGIADETFGKPCLEIYPPTSNIDVNSVLELLNDSDPKLCITRFAVPQGGHVFLYDTNVVDDLWQRDGYEWSQSTKYKKVKDSNRSLMMTTETAQDTEEKRTISRIVYCLEERKNIILVHYKDNEDPTVKDPEAAEIKMERPRRNLNATSSGGLLGNPFYTFDYRDALDMLQDCEEKLSTEAPVYPKAGEVYFFDTSEVGNIWKYDHYVWRNCGRRLVPNKKPMVLKSFYLIRVKGNEAEGSNAFRRIVYQDINRRNIIMVHYSGDETVFKPRPHGNRKFGTDVYTPSPSRGNTKTRTDALPAHRIKADPDSVKGKKGVERNRKLVITKAHNEDPATGEAVVAPSIKQETVETIIQMEVPPTLTSETDQVLPFDITIDFLRNHSDEAIVSVPMFPKAGEAYLYNTQAMHKRWRHDGYEWADVRSTLYHPREKPVVNRKLQCIKSDKDNKRGDMSFRRYCYALTAIPHILLVHYVGDERNAVQESEMKIKHVQEVRVKLNQEEEAEEEEESQAPVECVVVQELEDPPPCSVIQQEYDEEYVQERMQLLNQQKKNLQLVESKLKLEIQQLKDEIRELD